MTTEDLASAPETGQEFPPVAGVEVVENTTEHVLGLCNLLHEAAAR